MNYYYYYLRIVYSRPPLSATTIYYLLHCGFEFHSINQPSVTDLECRAVGREGGIWLEYAVRTGVNAPPRENNCKLGGRFMIIYV